jgi:hypothetical protein
MELGRSYAPELFDRGSKRNRKLPGTGSLAVVEDMTDKPGGAFGALTRGERRHPRHAPAQSLAIPSSASTEGFERPPLLVKPSIKKGHVLLTSHDAKVWIRAWHVCSMVHVLTTPSMLVGMRWTEQMGRAGTRGLSLEGPAAPSLLLQATLL